jgi:hypothetical protein
MEYYQTGDLILFKGNGYLSWLIEYFGECKYSHVGIVIVDPSETLKGPYLLDCSVTDNVKLRPIEEVIQAYDGFAYYRKMIYKRDEEFQKGVIRLYEDVKNAPYDVDFFDWLSAKVLLDSGNVVEAEKVPFSNPTDNKRFWCSALVAYIYVNIGLLPKETPWSIIAPVDFSSYNSKTCYKLNFNCSFEPERYIPR